MSWRLTDLAVRLAVCDVIAGAVWYLANGWHGIF
jgi:hypothetical protein